MASMIRTRAWWETFFLPLRAQETVAMLTPACSATSFMVTTTNPLSKRLDYF
jgi:hypothetical protein